jgi:flagellar protein FlgJ
MAALPTNASTTPGLVADTRSLEALRARANADPRGAAKEAARAFEGLFMQELLKSMRATVPTSGLGGEGPSAGLGTEMLDQQYATKLAGLPGGLSEAIQRQLERQMGLTPGPFPVTKSANETPQPLAAQARPTRIPQAGAAGFVAQHGEAAQRAEAETGIPAAFMVSQAALETGWGRKEIRHADGTPSFNLFGIKAGPNWKGPVAEVVTTEYVSGRAQKVTAKFRAYGSYAESFADYARLMKDSPRYAQVLAAVGRIAPSAGEQAVAAVDGGAASAQRAAGFALGLQRAGYATDPAYADKLTKVINTTLRLQRSMA